MGYQVACGCGNVLTVSEGSAGSYIPCGCGRTVPVPSLGELRSQGITAAPPPSFPALLFPDEAPPGPDPGTEIIPPTRVFLRARRGGRPGRRTAVVAALTPDTLWIQDTWQSRPVPLQGLGVEGGRHGRELTLTPGPEPLAGQLTLEFADAAEGERWVREIRARQAQPAPDAPRDDGRRPEGVALVGQVPDVPHEALGRVVFTAPTRWEADRGLQLRAAVLGADAVVGLHRLKCPDLGWGARQVSGLAVRVGDADARKRLRLRWYAEEVRALVGRLLVLLLVQAALLFLLAVSCSGASALHAATGETPSEALASAGAGLGIIYAWPLGLLALLWVLRWPQLLRATGLAALAVTAGRGVTVWAAHFLAVGAAEAPTGSQVGVLLDPVGWALVIAGVVLGARAWRLAGDARQILPSEVQAVPAARRAWSRGLLAVTGVYALALVGFVGIYRFQASTHLLQPGVDSQREQEAIVAMNEGAAHANRGDLGSAERSFRRALGLWEGLTARRLAPPIYRANLASTLCNLGRVRQRQGSPDEAEGFYARAVEVADELAGSAPEDADFVEGMADARLALAGLRDRRAAKLLEEKEQSAVRKYEEAEVKAQKGEAGAEDLYREAIALWEEVLPQATNEDYRKSATARLAAVYHQLGELQQQLGKLPVAEESLKKAIDYGEKAVALDPDRPPLRHHLELSRQMLERLRERLRGQALEDEVNKLCAAERFADAIDLRLRSVAEQEEEVRSGKDRDAAVRVLASRLNGLAWLLAHLPDGRLRDTKAAVGHARRATKLQPDVGNHWHTLALVQYRNGDWKDSLASLEKVKDREGGLDAGGWFLSAMSLHQLKRKKEARAALQKGVEWMDERGRQAEADAVLRFRYELMRPALEALRREAEKLTEGKDPADQGVG